MLSFSDQAQLTLALGARCSEALPAWVRERIEGNLASNRLRNHKLREVYAEVAGGLAARGAEFVVLKGFTHCPDFVSDPDRRVQYDLDLWLPGESLEAAREALISLGYEAIQESDSRLIDHLPAMVRKTGWRWRGDYFDPDIPVSIDLHFRLWNEETEGIAAPGAGEFWHRRIEREWSGLSVAALDPGDALGYAALHALRHLLRGSLRVAHVHEIAWFLHQHSSDDAFWLGWRGRHEPRLRRLESIIFRLAGVWFGCRVPADVEALPNPVSEWLSRYAWAPLETVVRPNKHELWLHLSLIDSAAKKREILRRRLVPLRLPGPIDAVLVPPRQLTWRLRLRSRLRYARHISARAWYHLVVLPSVSLHGAQHWWRAAGLGAGFLRFLGAATLFNLGNFIFVVLYNLFLLDLGYRENTLGLIAGSQAAGSIGGALLAWKMASGPGLRATVLASFAAAAGIAMLRTTLVTPMPLIALAALAGAAFSLYAISVSPVIARLAPEDRRPRAFSFFFATGIATGILGGWIAAWLPGWIAQAGIAAGSTAPKRAAILAGAVLMLCATAPVWRLKLEHDPEPRPAVAGNFPRRFLFRFLAPLALCGLATGAYQPFFNVYFSRIGATVGEIGTLFSASQFTQVMAILLAPAVFRRIGLTTGVMAMQVTMGIALALLPAMPALATAAACYAAAAAMQYMSEPGTFSLLMSRVPPGRRESASTCNFLVMFSAQALAAAAAGWAATRFGFGPVLIMAGALAACAGFLFRVLLKSFENPQDSRSVSAERE